MLPVAVGEAEAAWVERARVETVRALEKAVRAARAGGEEEEEEWTRFRVRLSPEDRATVDEALGIAGKLMPGSRRPQRLEAMAQEYLAQHAIEAGDDGGGTAGGSFRPDGDRLERRKAELEMETERWSFLPAVANVAAPDAGSFALEHMRSALEIDGALRDLAAKRKSWDCLLGYCAYVVKRSGLWHIAGFASFGHYCEERLGLSARTVEQRAALEKRLWQVPALRAARDDGLAYEKVRILSRLPDSCLVLVARHFVETWKPYVKKARTLSQKVRERDLGRCQMPGCSLRAVHAHHVELRSHGGADTPENLVALCACHHLRGIHGGYIHVWGRAPGELVWEVGGRVWRGGGFGRAEVEARAA